MKKRIMASLLAGSAVVGVSLAPLSAQVVTTENTSVQVEFGRGMSLDAGGDPNTVRPDSGATNSNSDLISIPGEYDFGKLSISDDLTKPIPNKNDAGRNGHTEAIGISDLRGTKEDWHVTTQSDGMKLGDESLEGNITTGANGFYALRYDENTSRYTNQGATTDMEVRPEGINLDLWNFPLAGDAVFVANATSGKGQGIWGSSMFDTASNIIISAYNIKAGIYIGNIVRNLVAGPSA